MNLEKKKTHNKCTTLQYFTGIVHDVTGDIFTATLYDMTNNNNGDEYAEIRIDALSALHRSRLRPGVPFSLRILQKNNRVYHRFHVRRPRFWTAEECAQIDKKADYFASLFSS